MSRYTGADCRQCRREGTKLFLKGERCYSEKCALEKRAFVPGQHGQGRKKISGYGQQLREKQKAKRFYGLHESQFAKYYEMATRETGVTGEIMLQFLERRLDNVVYRLGFASSRSQARQLVNHSHFTVNGHPVNIPSYLVKAGDVIAVKDTKKAKAVFGQLEEISKPMPKWLSVDLEKKEGKILALPQRDDVDLVVEEHLIVELYSK